LKKAGLRVFGDYRDNYSPGWKFNDWEMKGKNLIFLKNKTIFYLLFLGVPIRVEIGPNDKARSQLTVVLRHTGHKSTIPINNSETKLREILEQIHNDLYTK
jgi:prolyl-tRNA synthetase